MRINKLFTILLVIYTNMLQAQTWKELNPPLNIFNDAISSIATDTSGNIYAVGKFKNSKSEFIVGKWNGSNWSEVGAGNNALKANNTINCLVIDKMGNIYAAGGFTNSTGNISIAKWNGTTWSELGGVANALNPNGYIYTITIDKQGNLYAAGGFTDSLGNYYVAKWDGSNWSKLGIGSNTLKANGLIYSLTTDNIGNVYAAGHFTNTNGKYYVAKWNGTSWAELGGSVPLNANDYIDCIKTDNAGYLYAGGGFRNSAGEYYIAKWNGIYWAEVGNGANTLKANGPFNAIEINTTGTIYAGGFGTNLNGNTNVVKWDGNTWSEVFNVGYSINDAIRTICLDSGGNLYAAGDFKNNGGHNYVARWNGVSVKEQGFQGDNLQVNNGIYNVAAGAGGEMYATGNFNNALGDYYIAHWNGKTWSELGGDTASLNVKSSTVAMATDLSGNLYVTGNFTNSNGKYYIAKWDGHSWSELGNANNPIKIYEPLYLLTCDKKGNIYAGGAFGDSSGFSYCIMRWDGYHEFLYPHSLGSPCSLIVDIAGNLYAGNTSTDNNAKYYVEKINENGVTRLGNGVNALNSGTKITALAIDAKGNLLASGLNNAGYSLYNKFVAKWDGTTWSAAGSDSASRYADGFVTSMLSDDSGNVYAASSTNSNGYFSVAKWNGSNWSELGAPYSFNSIIGSLAKDDKGSIYAAGLFDNSSNQQYVAVYGMPVVKPEEPMLSAVSNQYCSVGALQSVKITNLPDTSFISVSVKLDNVDLALSTDSSFTFNPSILSPGNHQIKISYSTHTDRTFVIKGFNVITAVTPDVKVTASTTISTNSDPVIITAANSSGGGTYPKFTFFKDPSLNKILQQESTNSTLSLNPGELAVGENLIYVRMRTSDTCYTAQTSIDSIDIKRSTATGISDLDYPDQKIFPYPNPFSVVLRIKGFQASKSYTVSLTNSMGKIIFRRTFTNSTGINITEVNQPGAYWLTIYDNTKNRLLGTSVVIKN